MVMYRQGLPLVPTEQLGQEMGLVVPEMDRQLFWKDSESGDRPPAGWGTRIYLPEYSMNAVFARLKIGLVDEHHLIDEFDDEASAKAFLVQAEKDDADVLVCFDYGTLHDTDYHGGHVNVFDRIDGNRVRLVDPEYEVPKWRIVEMAKLFEAMKAHGPKNSAGFWKLTRTG